VLFGECKMTGGKLVTVELSHDATQIRSAVIRGDFFVNPEPQSTAVLHALEQSLIGRPIDLEMRSLSSHLAAAIPFGVELIGTTPDAIAIAVRRAITGDTQLGDSPTLDRIGSFSNDDIDRLTAFWKQLDWRIISEVPQSPAMNVALDEVLLKAVATQQTTPTLRFWRWSQPAVIIGRCQSIQNEVDLEAAAEAGITIVRRMTGGGAMFLQPHGAITYSLYLPETAVAGLTIRQSYEVCDAWVIAALRGMGVDAHHVPINDIACSAGKIGGAAQARRQGVVLHHTTIAYDMDPGAMVRILRIGREKLRDKAIASAQKRVSPLVLQTGLSRSGIVAGLQQSFQNRYGGSLSELSRDEIQAAAQLCDEKYASAIWTNDVT
jgi:lipoate---protein ligase